jgi:hypothetical protein
VKLPFILGRHFPRFPIRDFANPKTWLCIMGLRKQPKDISAGNPQPKDRRFDERGNDLDSAIIQITVPETSVD